MSVLQGSKDMMHLSSAGNVLIANSRRFASSSKPIHLSFRNNRAQSWGTRTSLYVSLSWLDRSINSSLYCCW
jgi:hypothetical protein